MSGARWSTLSAWAARDLLRRPGQSALFALCLALLATVMATPLLLTQALADTARALLRDSPSLVVRRVHAGGWSALPGQDAAARARRVPGVVRARPRIWGVARAAGEPVTVVGIELDGELGGGAHQEEDEATDSLDQGQPWPSTESLRPWLEALAEGGAVVGPGVAHTTGQPLRLSGAATLELEVLGSLDRELSMVAHDLVVLGAADARTVLGLEPGQASDLAVTVFHETEQDAIVPDLAAAFPWPVQITSRREMVGAYAGGAARRGSISMLALAPALLALVLLGLVAWRDGLSRRRELGLLKVFGWSTGDVAMLRAMSAVIVGLPAVLVGLVVAYQLVFWPGTTWAAELLLGWTGEPVALSLEPAGAALVVLEVGAAIVLPWLVASLWPVLRVAAALPEQLLTEERG